MDVILFKSRLKNRGTRCRKELLDENIATPEVTGKVTMRWRESCDDSHVSAAEMIQI